MFATYMYLQFCVYCRFNVQIIPGQFFDSDFSYVLCLIISLHLVKLLVDFCAATALIYNIVGVF